VILVDTSGVLAAIDPRQSHHAAAVEALSSSHPRLLSPFVLAELDYLVATHGGQSEELKLLSDVSRGAYQLESFTSEDVAAAQAVIQRYADLRLGLADASIVVLAVRHRCNEVLTLDQRHFRVVRGPGEKPFRLLPYDARQGA
jgi:predicted nucleic acid-binding protein